MDKILSPEQKVVFRAWLLKKYEELGRPMADENLEIGCILEQILEYLGEEGFEFS